MEKIVRVGEIFEIELDENPTTGFTYFSEETSEGLVVLKSVYIPYTDLTKRVLYGAAGIHRWIMKALQPGKQFLKVTKGQKWNESTWETETIYIYVNN
jgi:predicted secreted protein